MKKDYYKILGLNKDCTDADVKKAFRTLSMKWHPDKWVNGTDEEKKIADEKFKDIAESYKNLETEEKRRNIDMGGDPFKYEGVEDIFKMYNDLFRQYGGFNPFRQQRNHFTQEVKKTKPFDLVIDVNVTIEDFYNNNNINVKYERSNVCTHCNGSGFESDGFYVHCPACNGTGHRTLSNQYLNLTQDIVLPCNRCNGTGKIKFHPCKECDGVGLKNESKELKIKLPKGAKDGLTLRIQDKGNVKQDNVYGDLVIRFNLIPCEYSFNEIGDIYKEVYVDIFKCIAGGDEIVKLPDGKEYKIHIKPYTENNSLLKMANKGIVTNNFDETKSDVYLNIIHVMPKSLTDEELETVKKLIKDDNISRSDTL